MRATRSDNKLGSLAEADRETIGGWLRSGLPRAKVAAMVEDAHGFRPSASMLSRFWAEHVVPGILLRRVDAVKTATAVRDAIAESPGAFDEATAALLEQRAFDIAAQSELTTPEVVQLFKLLLDQRRIAVTEADSTLARQKFEFNAAEAVLEHADELLAIKGDRGLDNDARVDRVRQLVFGEAVPS